MNKLAVIKEYNAAQIENFKDLDDQQRKNECCPWGDYMSLHQSFSSFVENRHDEGQITDRQLYTWTWDIRKDLKGIVVR